VAGKREGKTLPVVLDPTEGEKAMTRKLSTFMSLVLGALLLASAGCEDEASKAALATCNSSYESLVKSTSAQTASIGQLKTELAQAQAKVQEIAKENELLKNPKMGKAEATKPAAIAKKPNEPAKKK
jgi:hypothetical protein